MVARPYFCVGKARDFLGLAQEMRRFQRLSTGSPKDSEMGFTPLLRC